MTVVFTARVEYNPQSDDFSDVGTCIENAVNELLRSMNGTFDTVDVKIDTGGFRDKKTFDEGN